MSAPTGSRRVSDHVSLEHRGDGCAIMWIQREPVNSMDRSLWEGMLSALEACEQEPGTRALVIASGVKVRSPSEGALSTRCRAHPACPAATLRCAPRRLLPATRPACRC